MKNAGAGEILKQRILQLEVQQVKEGEELKAHFHQTIDSLKPANLIKNTLKNALNAPDLTSNLLNTGIGIVGGLLAKKAFVGKSEKTSTNLIGSLIELLIANKIAKNGDEIRPGSSAIISKLIKAFRKTEKE